jgi:hypothetical protein
MAFLSSSRIAAAALALSNSGSQWSENGTDTMRRPVSQLFIWHSTMPFDSGIDGGEVVYTMGVYPYVLRTASSHGGLWKTDAELCWLMKSSHRGSRSGSRV